MVMVPPGTTKERGAAPRSPVEVRLPSGFDAMVSTIGAVEAEVARTAKQMSAMVQQQALFFERSYETQQETVAVLKAIQESMQEAQEQARRRTRPQAGADAQGEGERREGRSARVPGVGSRSAGPTGPTGGSGPGGDAEWQTTSQMGGANDQRRAEQQALQQAQQRLSRARAQPIATARQDLMRNVTRRISESQANEMQVSLDETSGRFRGPGGQFISTAAGEAVQRRTQVRNMARNVATNVGARGVGQGVLASLPTGAVTALGTGAAVVGAAEVGLQAAERWRAAGTEYQSALGVSAGEAQLERGRSALFTMSQRGGMGRQRAGQLYSGVTSLGLNDSRRDEALDFGSDMYRELGMSVQESIQMVSIAIETGERSFTELAESLGRVSEAAGEAGLSAEEARESFARNLRTTSGMFGGGESATISAEVLTLAQQSMGPRFQDLDLGQMLNEDQLSMVAAQRGMRFEDIHRKASTPEGLIEVLGWVDERSTEVVRNSGSVSGDFDQQLAAVMADMDISADDLGNIGDEQWRSISQELQDRGAIRGDPRNVAQQLGYAGVVGANTGNAMEMLTRQAAGAGPSAHIDEAAQRHRDQMSLQEGGARSSEIFGDNEAGGWSSLWSSNERTLRDIQQDYARTTLDSDLRNPVVEKLLAGDPSRHFRVKTPQGDRVVDLETAVRDFSDQLLSGDASIYSGDGAGKRVGDALGFGSGDSSDVAQWQDEAMTWGSSEVDEQGRLGDVGMSVEEAQAELEGGGLRGGDGASGHITISPSPALEGWLEIHTEGDFEVLNSQIEGRAPSGDIPPAHR